MPIATMQVDQFLNVWTKISYKTDIHKNHSHFTEPYLLNLISFLSSLETWPKLYLLIEPGVLLLMFIFSSKACILTWSFSSSSFPFITDFKSSSGTGDSISISFSVLRKQKAEI